MNEWRRFVQQQLDIRGWRRAELARRSGLSRQLISAILNDSRAHLGQMPEDTTIAGLAEGFALPEAAVRTAAARALTGYVDDGQPLYCDLSQVSADELLAEVRRRMAFAPLPDSAGTVQAGTEILPGVRVIPDPHLRLPGNRPG